MHVADPLTLGTAIRPQRTVTLDGNEAAASVAFKASELLAIYPITPATSMGELADQWASQNQTNLWGLVPRVVEMQSEAGVAGVLHGAVQTGSLCASFTCSQGLMLMIPDMFKLAGELTPMVLHVASRAVGTHGLSLFVEHNDVMSTRTTGFGILFGAGVQEAYDLAVISHLTTLEARIPFLHAFDGFRTSHEVQKIQVLEDTELRSLFDLEAIRAFKRRALNPDKPVVRGTLYNPDTYFQSREAQNEFFSNAPEVVQRVMDRYAAMTGRQYHPFDYVGDPEAERVLVIMGSAAETTEETVRFLNESAGEKVGVLKVRLFRPFSAKHLLNALPGSVRAIAVLDRTKEPGSEGEPLFLDVMAAVVQGIQSGAAGFLRRPRVVAGRYGLGGKEFTPGMVKAVFDELAKDQPRPRFTVGIDDDVTHLSLPFDPDFRAEPAGVKHAIFWGLGSDGTVSANKNTIKIIAEETDQFVQAFFVYDSKKSGSITESHLRFGPSPIRSTYLLDRAEFVGIHHFGILDMRPNALDRADEGATVLINSPYSAEETWSKLSRPVQETILRRRLKVWGIDAFAVANDVGLKKKISAIMQTAFFALSGVIPRVEAIQQVREAVRKTYGKRGAGVVKMNMDAIDRTLEALFEVPTPTGDRSVREPAPALDPSAPEFVRDVLGKMAAGRGNELPVSAIPADGTYPLGTTQYEKRNISYDAPVWHADLCSQCGKCVFVCPHAVIRAKLAKPGDLEDAPVGFETAKSNFKGMTDLRYTLQVSAEDCTGCGLCVEACKVFDKNDPTRRALEMSVRESPRDEESARWAFFRALPDMDPHRLEMRFNSVKNLQLLPPLIEFPGACSGCGEAPYIKAVSQLFGDRAVMSFSAGCAAVFIGNQPTCPLTTDREGRGPAYNCSLFEDNAEFGFGYRVSIDQQRARAAQLLEALRPQVGDDVADMLLATDPPGEDSVTPKRAAIARLREALKDVPSFEAMELDVLADHFVPRSVWIIGGDGWAYDIGFGGLDHVLASGANVNVLVLDSEVYSNTGGQASKSTPRGAVAKFAAGGKPARKKDLARMIMSYGNVYVAQIAMGAKDGQALKALIEAESYPGPSLVLAYSHCIAHGIDTRDGMMHQKLAVESGHWPLFRFDPRLAEEGLNPFQLDSAAPTVPVEEYMYRENRYKQLQTSDPTAAAALLELAKTDVAETWAVYEAMAR